MVEAGPGVQLQPGSRVMAVPTLPDGGLAEETLADVQNVYEIPDSVGDIDAAAMLIAFQTAHLGLHRRAQLGAGESLLVHAGAGGVGSAAIQLGVCAGARVMATAGGPEKVKVCRELGADPVIDYRAQDFVDVAREFGGGAGIDVIYDPVGGDVLERSTRCVASEGRILLIGFASGEMPAPRSNQVMLRNYSVLGVYVGAYSGAGRAVLDEVHRDLMSLHADKRIAPLIHAELPLEDVPQALEALAARRTVGKTVILP